MTNNDEPTNDTEGDPSSEKASEPEQKDLMALTEQIRSHLQSDQQKLKEAREQAQQAENKALVRRLTEHLTRYHFVEDFFLYLVQEGLITRLAEITPTQIEDFINRQPAALPRMRVFRQGGNRPDYLRSQAKQELKAFFSRAVLAGVIQKDPLTVQLRLPSRLEPQHPSAQTQADCQAFQQYLQRRVANNLLAPSTAANHYRYLLILLHDAEKEHTQNSEWPVELADLFANPKWMGQWLNKAENYAGGGAQKALARSSNKLRLNTIRYIWLWLKSEKRAADTYFKELKAMFSRFGDQGAVILPGRSPRIIEALSEAEVQAVFECIDRYSSTLIQRLRNRAMVTTMLQTAIRLRELNSMRIEKFREIEPGVWVSAVIKLRHAPNQPADFDGRSDWYMSPDAITQIGEYLHATGRNWHMEGPVWLTERGQPLSFEGQRRIISELLKTAGCHFTKVQTLRLTSIARMLNEFKLPLPVVQTITQCNDLNTLLHSYQKYSSSEAARLMNKLYPTSADTAPDEAE